MGGERSSRSLESTRMWRIFSKSKNNDEKGYIEGAFRVKCGELARIIVGGDSSNS